MQVIIIVLRIFVGLVFIASGFLKLNGIEEFGIYIADKGLITWELAPIFARILISFEIIIGLLLISNVHSKLVLKATTFILIVFTVYLGIDLLLNGNENNCQCFGSQLKLNSIESILKNLVLIGLSIFVYLKQTKSLQNIYVLLICFVIPIVFVFASKPVMYNPDDQPIKKGSALKNIDKIEYIFKNDTIDLSKGKKIVCFFVTNCKLCKYSALKLGAINKDLDYKLPIYIILLGKEEQIPLFLEKAKIDAIPYQFFHFNDTLASIVGTKYPVMYILHDGYIYKELSYSSIDKEELAGFFMGKNE